ncbi:MAG: ABC transporter ATP-binding protein [Clostridiales bacterium]|nr:ABC transporter ATP-binding protein [Clostridiales bacterium]
MRLTIKNLSVSYENIVIDSLNLTVENGEFCTLIGHSGTGKSTILKSVAGLIDIQADDITLNGESILTLSADKREIGFVFQKPLLFPHLTVEENISFSLEIRKWSSIKKVNRVNELIQLLELEGLEKRYPNEISGGQQQRVAIGRAMAFNPKIILMDEPFSSLDPRLRISMGEFLKELQIKLNLTIVFVTHDPLEALRLSDKIAFVHQKTIIQNDIPNVIYNKPKAKIIGDFFGKANWIDGIVKDNMFSCDFFKIEMIVEEGLYTVLLRPHQIEILEGDVWLIEQVKLLGKETHYLLRFKDHFIWVEVKGEPKNKLGDTVNIHIENIQHYLKR